MRVSEEISVSQYVLSEEWELFEICEIRVKQICVNQGLGVFELKHFWFTLQVF